ncbi:DUF1566 domain-containing protein, partial [Flavobacteriaceae bacterium]|nr:DUF1566 domain-containing protein [Flavobacteriaceae bacterium]
RGGTNITSYTQGDILYATSLTALTKLAKGTAGQVLTMNSGATAPEWVDSPATYSVNTYYAELGGYVIEVRDGGKHGLAVAMQDQALNPGDVMNLYDANSVINDPDYHDVDGDKFMDWRLPTKRELNLIYDHFNSGDNAAGLGNGAYMSSSLTQGGSLEYWWFYFGGGMGGLNGMNSTNHVRAVRAF